MHEVYTFKASLRSSMGVCLKKDGRCLGCRSNKDGKKGVWVLKGLFEESLVRGHSEERNQGQCSRHENRL